MRLINEYNKPEVGILTSYSVVICGSSLSLSFALFTFLKENIANEPGVSAA